MFRIVRAVFLYPAILVSAPVIVILLPLLDAGGWHDFRAHAVSNALDLWDLAIHRHDNLSRWP
jgi:hypothetical protein